MYRYHKKIIVIYIAMCLLCTGCINEGWNGDTKLLKNETIDTTEENDASDKQISLSHGLVSSMMEPMGVDIIYDGGDAKIDYYVSTSGMAYTGVGFLIFLNGIAQPYYIMNDTSEQVTEKKSEYMYVFYPQDNEKETFQFCFVPVTGKKDDVLEVCIASVYYPGYCPDMLNNPGYGHFHDMIEGIYSMKFEESPLETQSTRNSDQITNLRLFAEDISTENKEALLKNNAWTEEDFLHNIAYEFWIDGKNMAEESDYNIDGKSMIHLCIKIFGFPEAEYGITFYMNHIPLFFEDNSSWIFIQKNNTVTQIEADIDVSQIDGKSTVYAVLAPINSIDIRTDTYTLWLQKTKSILLWKSEFCDKSINNSF